MKFVDPKTDIAFKKIFGNDAHKSILIEFLNEMLELDYPIESVEILNSYQPPKFEGLKNTSLDVKAKDSSEREFIVEMQVAKEAWFLQRAMFYSSKAYSGQLSIGENYHKLKPVIFLGILNFDTFKTKSHFSRHLIINRENHEHDLKDLEWNFIELKKFKKTEYELETVAEKWIYFIQQATNLDHIPENVNTSALKLAYNIAEQHQWTAEELAVYDSQEMEIHRNQNVIETARMEALEAGIKEGIEQGIEQGIEKGIEQGELKTKQSIAKGMLTKGLDLETITELTGLTHAEIQNLI
ncbi:MAG: Rpn family recombination-promoting nuclease/putative transposase [Methylococcales bacterium]|nr:Rpn family recombination-promoting nuclease/putative transposase [Methylococcales bacterium]MDD5753895.1 Rpn family recombination-promoting nuclease/putative transposase [Methylococcales bacterium]